MKAVGAFMLVIMLLGAEVLHAGMHTPPATPTATPTCTPGACAPPSCPPGGAIVCQPCGCDCRCAPTATPTPTPPGAGCAGDCDGDGRVTIAELVRGVAVALGIAPAARCGAYADCGASGCLQRLVEAVADSLHGCARTVTPTATPPACGDPATQRRFVTCRQAGDAEACAAAGGRWGPFPYSQRPGCFCPTGQNGCPCAASTDCLGRCFAFASQSCAELRTGLCSGEEPRAGCWCEFGPDGVAWALCDDP